jgi:large subunit ribosomal protein L32e
MDFGLLKKQGRNYKMADAKLLEKRKEIKTRKPTFIRQCSHKIAKVKSRWRRARGIQSKVRIGFKGRAKCPGLGYCSPKAVKGLNRAGLEEVRIARLVELEKVTKDQVVVIANIGMKKKVELIKACQEKKIPITNVKDVAKYLKDVETDLAERKENRKQRNKAKKKKEESLKKKGKKEETKEEKKEETKVEKKEETKKGQKSDKIKILEQGQ